MSKVRRYVAIAALAAGSAVSTGGVALVTTGGTVGAFPPPGQCKNIGGNCNGNSENAPPHCAQLPAGQQKKCT
jgi:hypothetical protein